MSPPNHDGLSKAAFGVPAGDSLRNLEGSSGGVAALLSSAASSLLFFKASSKSTRSLHCNSMLLRLSCSAFSVSVLGT